MCGIIGYVGKQNAIDVLLEGLSNLEYRGYDSAGISVFEQGAIATVKQQGRLQELAYKMEKQHIRPTGCCGIGHTRWATHGAPSERNSHPHCTDRVSLVHNGIVENYLDLKRFLAGQGRVFLSETDTETAVRLIDYHYKGDPFQAICAAVREIEGSYAFGILFADRPGTIYAVRKDSPLIVGVGDGENYIASDVPAILSRTRRYYLLEELEIAEITQDTVSIRDLQGNPVHRELLEADWDMSAAQKGGYPHFMLKEINEQPKALRDTVHPRVRNGLPDFSADGLPDGFFQRYRKLHIVACGTANHAGLVSKALIERLARLPVEVDLASEFRYRDPILAGDTLVVVISQSGETADTLAALRLAKSMGTDTLAVVNVTGSSIAREADYVIHTYAGPEIAVASTKAFSVQIAVGYLLAMAFAYAAGQMGADETKQAVSGLLAAIDATGEVLDRCGGLQQLAGRFLETGSLFYIGRGLDYSLAMEGSLKLKEISYIHSECYAAGELKHGTISLITQGVPVVALATQQSLLPKTVSNIKEVRSRGGYVLLITKDGVEVEGDLCDHILRLPDLGDLFMPLLSVIALQVLAYHVSVARGCDVDKPRNLAKSVTVE